MHIIHLCLANHFSDGYSYQENLLTKYHRKIGFEVTVLSSQWTFDNNGKLVKTKKNDYFNEDGVRIIRLPTIYGNSKTRLKIYRNLYDIIGDLNPDIIFIHCPQFLNIITVGKYLKKHPYVKGYIDNHSDYSNSATSWISKNIQHKIIWRFCVGKVEKYIKKFYGVLPARVDFMRTLYGVNNNKCELLLMGADDELVNLSMASKESSIRKKYGISSNDFLIVTGGKIDLAKIQTINLLEAVKKLNKTNVKLIVFGSVVNELKEKVERLSDGKQIKYVGWIDSMESYEYFAAADLVVFPGRHSVFWEQVVAQGKPLVVKDWQGTHHIDIGGNVMYLYNDTAEEIYNVLKKLTLPKSELYRKLKKSAESEARKKFLYSVIAKKSIGINEDENYIG